MRIGDLGAWFQNPSAQCSSHHGADNYEPSVFGAYVYENYGAWTQGNANPYCLSIELCGYAEWSRSEWLNNYPVLVDNAAEWLRYVVDKYNIPWVLLNDSEAQDPNRRGIVQHVNLGNWGSGHWDCGRDTFPIDVILEKAMSGSQPTPPKPEPITVEDDIMVVIPPADIDSKPFDISLPGNYKALGLFADASLYSGSIHVRAAFYTADGTGYQVIDIYCYRSSNKTVVWPQHPFSAVSLRRMDNEPVNITPDFGR
jgi:hypothetical protein